VNSNHAVSICIALAAMIAQLHPAAIT